MTHLIRKSALEEIPLSSSLESGQELTQTDLPEEDVGIHKEGLSRTKRMVPDTPKLLSKRSRKPTAGSSMGLGEGKEELGKIGARPKDGRVVGYSSHGLEGRPSTVGRYRGGI
jgi:hypothetical protein